MINRIIFLLAAGLIVGALGGCGSSSNSDSTPATGYIQIVNAIVDAPELDIEIELDDETIQTYSDTDFGESSRLVNLDRDTYELVVSFEDPADGSDDVLIASTEFEITRNDVLTAILRGTMDAPDILWLEKPLGDVDDEDSEEFELQIVNLSDRATSVYLGDDDENISAESLIDVITAGSNTEPTLIAHTEDIDYRLRLTEDSATDVRFDSGEISIPAGTRRLILIHNTFGPDADSMSAFMVTAAGTEQYANEVAQPSVRILNAVADDTAVEVILQDPSSSSVLDTQNLAFSDVSDFLTVAPSFINAQVTAASASATTFQSTVSLNEDTFFTILVGGSALEDDIIIRSVTSEHRPIATRSNILFINALRETDVEDFDRVDFYALQLGEALADTPPLFSQVQFMEGETAPLPATTFDFVVTTAGSQSILAGPTRVTAQGSTSLTLMAAEGYGGGLPYQVLVDELVHEP